jgi:hypothetical protein
MSIHLIIRDADGYVENAIAYDGESAYDPGEGRSLVAWDEEARPWIGWTRNSNGSYMPPHKPEPTEPE